MGRWRASFIISRIVSSSNLINNSNFLTAASPKLPRIAVPKFCFSNIRPFSALPSPAPNYDDDFDFRVHDFNHTPGLEDEEAGKIPVKAFFLCTRYFSYYDYTYFRCIISVQLTLVCQGSFLFKSF